MPSIHPTAARRYVAVLQIAVLAVVLVANPAAATTYISAEPVPSRDVVGDDSLAKLQSIGFADLERWSRRLLDECRVADHVIQVLSAYAAITTIDSTNTTIATAAGGFEGTTNPTYVLTLRDGGPGLASAADIRVLGNILGYVLNQAGTAFFTPDNARANDFTLDYAVVTFTPPLEGMRAKAFFDYVGTIDPALWSGLFAGFTQIDFAGSPTNNSMLFLRPAVTKHQFITGLSTAAETTDDATYVTRNNHGEPTTARAGVAFPGNDWLTFPDGDQYLAHLAAPSPSLLNELALLRQQHLAMVDNLLRAIERGTVRQYLDRQFRCA